MNADMPKYEMYCTGCEALKRELAEAKERIAVEQSCVSKEAFKVKELRAEVEQLKQSHGQIYISLGTQEADCSKWPTQIAHLRAEVERLRCGWTDERDARFQDAAEYQATITVLRAEVERLRKIESYRAQDKVAFDDLRTRYADLEQDKTRIDWLEARGCIISRRFKDGLHFDTRDDNDFSPWNCTNGDTLRQAIDAAMKGTP
jgi:chromosome segregation ATPase